MGVAAKAGTAAAAGEAVETEQGFSQDTPKRRTRRAHYSRLNEGPQGVEKGGSERASPFGAAALQSGLARAREHLSVAGQLNRR